MRLVNWLCRLKTKVLHWLFLLIWTTKSTCRLPGMAHRFYLFLLYNKLHDRFCLSLIPSTEWIENFKFIHSFWFFMWCIKGDLFFVWQFYSKHTDIMLRQKFVVCVSFVVELNAGVDAAFYWYDATCESYACLSCIKYTVTKVAGNSSSRWKKSYWSVFHISAFGWRSTVSWRVMKSIKLYEYFQKSLKPYSIVIFFCTVFCENYDVIILWSSDFPRCLLANSVGR